MSSNPGPIGQLAAKCKQALYNLYGSIETKISGNTLMLEGVDLNLIRDCRDRFNMWTGSLGALQRGAASLDSRLSDHEIAQEIIRLLKQLQLFISDIISLVDGVRPQKTWSTASIKISLDQFSDSDSDTSDDEVPGFGKSEPGEEDDKVITESNELCLMIHESVMSLMRLSIIIHKSSQRNKLERLPVPTDQEIELELAHIYEAFPLLRGREGLARKLGKANAQRRQWLGYRRSHHEKLARHEPQDARETDLLEVDNKYIPNETMESEVADGAGPEPSIADTKATTYVDRTGTGLESMSPTMHTETFFSQSSFGGSNEWHLLIPRPPISSADGQPFQCPYCFNIIEISGRNTWQKHVHADLSSYVCTFETCDKTVFESRYRWLEHELCVHRKEWSCDICNSLHFSAHDMQKHLLEKHSDKVQSTQIPNLAEKFSRPRTTIPATDCPFCDYSTTLQNRGYFADKTRGLIARDFGKHLSRHLEQLALLVLPLTYLVEEENEVLPVDDRNLDDSENESDTAFNENEGRPEIDESLENVSELSELLNIEVSCQQSIPEAFPEPPDLAMRWQPPHDFTPPKTDFDTDDGDLLPLRQEPIYGGDLYTPGWARGSGQHQEGYCGRCRDGHWVNIPDGSYKFHLTYFHGVPPSGVPLPRPPEIRRLHGKLNVWEGYCEACAGWRVLKKTTRGWNWYRHWLRNHSAIVTSRTEAEIRGERTRKYDACVPGAIATVASRTQVIKVDYTKELTHEGIRAVLLDLSIAYEPDLSQISDYLKSINPSSDLPRVIDAEVTSDMTALMLAASEGNSPVVQLLLDCGADPNLSRSDHHTAADLAGDAGYFTISQLLLNKGGDMSLCHLLRRILIERRNGVNLNQKSPGHKTEELGIRVSALSPICRAAFDGDVENMRHMLRANPASYDIEDGAENGLTPFILASLNCHLEVMDLLLSLGANVNATSNRGWTPLMLAVKRNDIQCVRALLVHGSDVNHLSPDRWTALAEATNNGFTHLMTLLLQADADTESKSQHDWTPLMHACFRGDLVAVDILLNEGTNISISSSRDETPMLLAAASGSVAILERLLKAGSVPDATWSKTHSYSETDDGFEGVEDGSDAGLLERAYQVGWTPLMLACQIGSVEIVRLLLDAGVNTQSRSPLLKTALEIAKENGRTDVIETILARSCQRG